MKKTSLTIARSALVTMILGAFSFGIFIGSGVMGILSPFSYERAASSDSPDGSFKYIRPQLEVKDDHGKRLNRELKPFRYKVNTLVEERIRKNEVAAVSVYFRDLNNGNWFGIREREKFSPKNSLKIPLMIAYFKQAESNPFVLRKTLRYEPPKDPVEQKHVRPANSLEPGNRYTVNDLIYRMVAYDDSEAYSLLLRHISPERLEKVFRDLNVEYDPHSSEDTVSLRDSAAFYRVLFNASYLNEDMSEKALRYLSKSLFKDGMASAIPANIDIASKFGERASEPANGQGNELYHTHEFAIIYHPHRPFLVGVMARGENFNELIKTIRDITRLIYDEVDKQS